MKKRADRWVKLALPRWLAAAGLMAVVLSAASCRKPARPEVVVYTAQDEVFARPLFDEFERRTGIHALAKYDTESTKTVGLVNAIRAERDRPRCDVFWNNEILNTIRLKKEGLLAPFTPEAAAAFPATFRDAEGYWTGFAGRARVLLVNTNLVAPPDFPTSVAALADPRWKGRAGMAKPLFGTTATQAACLFAAKGAAEAQRFFEAVKANEVRIHSGNKGVAMAVSAGTIAFGITDTDDATGEVESGKPVAIAYPDSGKGEDGVLFIPNTLALVKGAPHPDAAKKLIEFLLSPDSERMLAESESAQIPLNPAVRAKVRVKTPADVPARAARLPPAESPQTAMRAGSTL